MGTTRRIRWWEVSATAMLAGYVILSYGFANLVVRPGGIPFQVGHLLALPAFGWLCFLQWPRLREVAREPAVIAIGVLILFSMIHLVSDVPQHGLWALRDALFPLEGGFLLLGTLWAMTRKHPGPIICLLGWILLATFLYSLLSPAREWLRENSPVVGAMRPVALVGSFPNTTHFLCLGAAGGLLLAHHASSLKTRAGWLVLAAAVSGWTFIFQARSAYLTLTGLVIVAFVLVGWKRGAGAMFTVLGGAVLFFSLTYAIEASTGHPVQGRRGPARPQLVIREIIGLWSIPKHIARGLDPNGTGQKTGPGPKSLRPEKPATEEPVGGQKTGPGPKPLRPEKPATEEPVEGRGDRSRVREADQATNPSGDRGHAWRIQRMKEAWSRWTRSTSSMIFGIGFGEPLTEHGLRQGQIVRQPHNSHLSMLARLGLVGAVVWILLNLRILYLLVRSIRSCDKGSPTRSVFIWLLFFFVSGHFVTSVQPWLEFSYGAVPFFTVMGFALHWARTEPSAAAAPTDSPETSAGTPPSNP